MGRIWSRVLFALVPLDRQFSTFNYHKMQFDAMFPGSTQAGHALVYFKSRPANAFPYVLSFLIPKTQSQKYITISSPPVMSLGAPTASATEVAAS